MQIIESTVDTIAFESNFPILTVGFSIIFCFCINAVFFSLVVPSPRIFSIVLLRKKTTLEILVFV